ncbi:MAG TPA: glycosyl hydrolase, partial [Sedimentisphaerales bacterium]|nr:glycosyl hydrolase [Sedimentisphaerales bacterium]
MKRILFITTVFFVFFSGLLLASPYSSLESGFKNPPDSAKPHTWWHWMNGNISHEGITADLEAMAEVGIAGAQIFNVSVNILEGPAPFMSPQWFDLIEYAAVEADRLGIELCLHNSAGWSSSGGPWITPEHSMQIIVYADTKTTGPAQFNQILPQPKANLNYYRDIAILAFPTPKDDQFRIADLQIKTGLKTKDALEPDLADTPLDTAVTQD